MQRTFFNSCTIQRNLKIKKPRTGGGTENGSLPFVRLGEERKGNRRFTNRLTNLSPRFTGDNLKVALVMPEQCPVSVSMNSRE